MSWRDDQKEDWEKVSLYEVLTGLLLLILGFLGMIALLWRG
jgi:Tfp pilus assembly protein PilV